VGQQIGNQIETESDNTFKQIELGDERQAEVGGDSPGNVQHRPQHTKQKYQQQPPQEVGDGQGDAVEEVNARLGAATPCPGAEYRRGASQGDGNQQCKDREFERGG